MCDESVFPPKTLLSWLTQRKQWLVAGSASMCWDGIVGDGWRGPSLQKLERGAYINARPTDNPAPICQLDIPHTRGSGPSFCIFQPDRRTARGSPVGVCDSSLLSSRIGPWVTLEADWKQHHVRHASGRIYLLHQLQATPPVHVLLPLPSTLATSYPFTSHIFHPA